MLCEGSSCGVGGGGGDGVTNLRAEQHHQLHDRRARLHAHQTCSKDTYSTVRSLSCSPPDAHTSLRDTEISSKKTLYCQWFQLAHTVIVVGVIKSMPQRRQEQTAGRIKGARRGGGGKRGEGAGSKERKRSTLRQRITKTGRQEEAGGQRDESVTLSSI